MKWKKKTKILRLIINTTIRICVVLIVFYQTDSFLTKDKEADEELRSLEEEALSQQ